MSDRTPAGDKGTADRIEAMMRALHGALSAGAQHAADVGGLQACSVAGPEWEDGLPIEEPRTLIDGYFDLRRSAGSLIDAL